MSLPAFLRTRYAPRFTSRAAVATHQARAMDRFRARVMPRSPFYRDLAQAPAEAWPRMTKQRLMTAFTAINTCGIERDHALEVALAAETSRDFGPMIGDVSVGLSTGTSGQRGLFLATPRERALWAAILAGRFWPDLARRQRVAFFMRADNALYRTLSNPLVAFEFFDLLAPMAEHLPRLAALDPTVLIAPAQVLAALAREAPAIRPARVISVAESLSPDDRAVIRAAFGRPVDEVYQATEGVLAFTCRAGSLHLNERWLRVDRDVIDDATGAFCPVVSDFTRASLPILNYRLDDVLVPDPEPCPCGCATARIARIEGREDDMLWWPGAAGPVMVPSEAIRSVVAGLPHPVRDYRIVARPERLEVWLDAPRGGAGIEAEVQGRMTALAERLRARPPVCDVRLGLPPQDGKRRRIVRAGPAGPAASRRAS